MFFQKEQNHLLSDRENHLILEYEKMPVSDDHIVYMKIVHKEIHLEHISTPSHQTLVS
jgi:hypothetical protein